MGMHIHIWKIEQAEQQQYINRKTQEQEVVCKLTSPPLSPSNKQNSNTHQL